MGSCSTLSSFPISAAIPVLLVNQSRTHRRRIAPQAGRALEILGHAIEYLSDEFAHAGGCLSAHNAQVEAVQVLIAANRQIYFACPEIPSVSERWRAMLRKAAVSR
jgi:hypothetical protein